MMPLPADERKRWRHGLPRCAHRDAAVVTVTTAAGARAVRWQCSGCGKIDSTVLRLADYPDAPPANAETAAAWLALDAEARAAAGDLAKQRYAMRQAAKPLDSADWFAEYSDYLDGDEWQRLRSIVLARDGHRCQAALPGCTRTASQVHHRSELRAYSYHRRLGTAPAFACASVCEPCHRQLTEADRAERGER